jgi:hypothetical protein
MKRCGMCNDILMKDGKDYKSDDVIECFVCGLRYKIITEWKTHIDKSGMFCTSQVHRLTLL